MTNKEALIEVAQIPLSDTTIAKVFLDAGMTDSGAYISANEQQIDFIAIEVLSNFLAASVSEGEYSIDYKNSIDNKIQRLKTKWGVDVTDDPGVQDVSYLW